jgi:Trypsin-like peptidase domain/Colicin V production protein
MYPLRRHKVGHVPGDLLDLILLVLVVAFAVAGYRQGFIIGVLSFGGFLGGGALGAIFAPRIAQALVSSQDAQALVAIIVVFSGAVLGQLLASGLGVALRSRLTWRPATLFDSLGGAAVSVLSVLLIAWLIGSAVAYGSFPVISRQVNDSLVLRTVDELMPPAAVTLFSEFRTMLANGPYTEVFSALGAEGALNVGPPNPRVVFAAGVRRAEDSVVKIEGIAPSCSRKIEGSGFVYAPDHVITNAHVVAGVTIGPDVYTSAGTRFRARVVLYDPETDIAVLYVPGLNVPPLRFVGLVKSGTSAVVAGYPLDHPLTAVAARIGGYEEARSLDIYQSADVTRQIYSIRAIVQPGNSGGPLLATDGKVYGVVFAAAVDVPDTGYALTSDQVGPDATRGFQATTPVSTETCD